MNFKPLRLSVVLLGDRLAIAALRGARVETFIVEAENPADALRAELEARGLPARNAFFALSRSVVTVKPIDLPPVAGDVRQMVGFELERHLAFSPENASYDFVPLPPDPSAERAATAEQRVLITAADQRVVESAVRLATDAHLRAVSLTVAAHNLPTLARLPRGSAVGCSSRSPSRPDAGCGPSSSSRRPSGRAGSRARRASPLAWRRPPCCSASSRSSPRAGVSSAT